MKYADDELYICTYCYSTYSYNPEEYDHKECIKCGNMRFIHKGTEFDYTLEGRQYI